MTNIDKDVRTLIAVRVVVVTTLLVVTLLIQYTVDVILPINYLYLTAAICYGMTFIYVGLAKAGFSRRFNLYLQMFGDIVIETLLIYFTGGLDSPFSFLYLISIITAAMLLYRRGGLITASLSVILYGTLVDLIYYGVLAPPAQSFFSPTQWSSLRLYLNLGTNFAGFYATALLTSYISEQLRRTFQELDVNRQDLAKLEALNQNVVQSIPSGLMTMSPEGTVTFLNPAGVELLQITQETIVGRKVTDTRLFNDQEWAGISEDVATKGIVRGEHDFERGGERRSFGYALTPLSTLQGGPAGLTLIFQDLTEMKKLEAQLRLKDRMAAVGELSAGIAHEIRNPLAAIAGSVQVLRNSKNLTPQEQRLMSIVLKESDRLNQSIADFLRFVKPQERMAAEFDIAVTLSETLDLFSNSLELNQSHVIERIIDPPNFVLVGDANQIRQVFWNIAKNAIQAMPDGGILRVTVLVDDDFYRINFSDSGRGMAQSELHMIFQPFRTRFPTGTGLGMAISYRIVQEHGGRIEIHSLEGEGTTITIAIPTSLGHELSRTHPRAVARESVEAVPRAAESS